MADILERIDAAIERITSGHAPMRVPAEETDPDLVLSDCREQISELRTALFRERASVPPVGERERLEKELLRRFAPANLSAHAAEAPCISCGYNGAGYWQSGTHHPGCVVRDIGGLDERIAAYRAILSSPAPDPPVSERERRLVEVLAECVSWISGNQPSAGHISMREGTGLHEDRKRMLTEARALIIELAQERPYTASPAPEPQEPGERCESGLPDCGPATGYSLDDVPLCERCGKELEAAPDPASEPRAIECRSTCARAGCQNLRPHWCSSCGEVDNWEDHYKFHGYCSDDCRAADEAPPFGAVR